ncbi:hypothetical protein ISN44_As12g031470 [Arabidopsis suecica]|uniref:Uncharacterized protein n=1 Tax=Arabidopsis suecica TaxID=45249 RepID=A0A8T1YPN4_ARASU|nr:hypothetical protein ISN44_As12g031470 [Arabidopsis suecica]
MQRTSEEYNSQEQHDKQKRKFPSLKYKSLRLLTSMTYHRRGKASAPHCRICPNHNFLMVVDGSCTYRFVLQLILFFQNDIPLTGRLGLTCSSPYFKDEFSRRNMGTTFFDKSLSDTQTAHASIYGGGHVMDLSDSNQTLSSFDLIATVLSSHQIATLITLSHIIWFNCYDRNLVNIENQKLTLGKDNEKSYARNVLFSHVPPCLKSEKITCKQEESFFMSRKHEYFCGKSTMLMNGDEYMLSSRLEKSGRTSSLNKRLLTKSCTKEATKLITMLLEIIHAVDRTWTYHIRAKLSQVVFCLSFIYLRQMEQMELKFLALSLTESYKDGAVDPIQDYFELAGTCTWRYWTKFICRVSFRQFKSTVELFGQNFGNLTAMLHEESALLRKVGSTLSGHHLICQAVKTSSLEFAQLDRKANSHRSNF